MTGARCLALAASLAVAACTTGPTTSSDTPNGLVGTWRLISVEDRSEGLPTEYPYGKKPVGVLIYDATGHMAVQFMTTPHPHVASGDDTKITDAEKIALFDAYTAYFGTYSVDADKGVITHHVEADAADVYIGQDQARPYVLKGDQLILTPTWEDGGHHWEGRRVFERVH